VITQSRLLSYIDIYFGLVVLSAAVLCLLFVSRSKNAFSPVHFITEHAGKKITHFCEAI
jgi:hypothetical protein